ncbi:hypothetical protein ALC60_01328 [Trachymyrmex zeteki]|uniref:Uncharacterized protein n=1 Tax=Mycetomoellerius zeteki TaxID=64791 RepID=A0A151XGY1_9HYME|nr:hypothetical protein ALC60_01328 [Trachymyrmex zeteki]
MDPLGPRHGTPRSRSETYALYVTGHTTAFPPSRTVDHAIPITDCECSYYRPVIDQSVLTKKSGREKRILRMSCEKRGAKRSDASKRGDVGEAEQKEKLRR